MGIRIDQVQGLQTSLAKGTSVKTANYTVTTNDNRRVIKCDGSGGAFTVTLLPAETAGDGFEVTIVKTSDDTATATGAITIQANGSELIGGANNTRLQAKYAFTKMICDGSAWYVIDCNDYLRISFSNVTVSPSDTPVNITSLAIPNGDWTLNAEAGVYRNGATLYAHSHIIDVNSAAFTDYFYGENYNADNHFPTTSMGDSSWMAIPQYRRYITAGTPTKTYYYNVSYSFTGGPPNTYGAMTARRVG